MKYKIGDLVWDCIFDEFGIIIDVRDNLYRIRWCTGNIQESRERERDINQDPIKNLLTTERIPF
tara:strand:- start:82 stop:273 length:192 start_codon:yes stop_codon:yes gene_type:complete